VRLLKAMKIEVMRPGSSEVIRGEVVESEAERLLIRGNLQPERNIKLMREVYGERVEGAIKVYTKTKLRSSSDSGEADRILYDDNEYEVSEIRKYDTMIPHYKAIAIRMKDDHRD